MEVKEQQRWNGPIQKACRSLAKKALRGHGSNSLDVIDTFAEKLSSIAVRHAEQLVKQNADWNIVVRTIEYMEQVQLVAPASYTDTAWFSNKLSTITEFVLPPVKLTQETTPLLRDIQHGIRRSMAASPVDRSALRISEESAKDIRFMIDAACDYGVASCLLDLCESLYHGDKLSIKEEDFLRVAAIAAPLARLEREERGLGPIADQPQTMTAG